MEQLSSHWKDFHEIRYLRIFRKSVEEIQFALKYNRIMGTLNEDLKYMYDNFSLISS